MRSLGKFMSRRFSEVLNSQNPKIPRDNEETIFDKIVKGEIPCRKVYEDDLVLAFHDISPKAPVHIILIPKSRNGLLNLSTSQASHQALLGHMLIKSSLIAEQQNLKDGWRLISNVGVHGCQSVYHLHFHILGGCQLSWSPS